MMLLITQLENFVSEKKLFLQKGKLFLIEIRVMKINGLQTLKKKNIYSIHKEVLSGKLSDSQTQRSQETFGNLFTKLSGWS